MAHCDKKIKWVYAAVLQLLVLILLFGPAGTSLAKPGVRQFRAAFLRDARKDTAAEINFIEMARFYGLSVTTIDISKAGRSKATQDGYSGQHFPIIAVSAETLAGRQVNEKTVIALRRAVEAGSNLLVLDIKTQGRAAKRIPALEVLTDGKVRGVARPQDSELDYLISKEPHEITRELGGLKLNYPKMPKNDFSLLMAGDEAGIERLIDATDDYSRKQPIFARYKKGKGEIFLLASEQKYSLRRKYMRELYKPEQLPQIAPIMMFLRYVGSDRIWHRHDDYANLTIDDPPMTEPYGNLSYVKLLREMEAHGYHTTIAFVPWNYDRFDQEVVEIFLRHPNRYSLVVHGNNHDNREFYRLGQNKLPVALPSTVQAKKS